MNKQVQIHWHEGLFLQPHHLQAQQRLFVDRAQEERRLSWAYPYGVVEARLSPDAIENMLVRFDRLRVVMPSGIEVDVPGDADLPPLDIKAPFQAGGEAFTVYLGIPLYYPNRANVIEPTAEGAGNGGAVAARRDDWRVNRLYRVAETELRDENTGQNPQPAQIRRVNARLLLDGDDRTDLEVLPVIRIAHGTGQGVGLPRQDPSFLPPCMLLSGSPVLSELVRDLANQVEASRKELVSQTIRGGFSVDTMRGAQFEQVLRLRTLNRFSVRLAPLASTAGVTPFVAYQELRELLAELAALQPDKDNDAFNVPAYDHDNPAIAFTELSRKLRARLRGTVSAKFLQVAFVREGRIAAVSLTDEHLKQPNEYFLGIQTKEDPRAVTAVVEDADRFRLLVKSVAVQNQRIWGVKLAEERNPPIELPAHVGLNYYRLLRNESARMWERIVAEKAMAVHWPELVNSDFAMTLYMTVPDN